MQKSFHWYYRWSWKKSFGYATWVDVKGLKADKKHKNKCIDAIKSDTNNVDFDK